MIKIRAALAQLDINRLADLALWLALLVGVIVMPLQISNFAVPALSLARLASAPELQTRTMLGDVPYKLLRESHQLLPPGAAVLLVTDGSDVRHREYTVFHRALYYLTPHPVYWLSAAPPDGTWESRWWHSAPLTESAISQFARSKNADFILLVTNHDLFPSKHTLARGQGARLVQITGGYLRSAAVRAPEFAPPDWHWRVFATLALFMLNGTLVLAVLGRDHFAVGPIEWLALSWSIGIGVVTFVLLGLLALGFSLAVSIWLNAGLALAGALLLIARFAGARAHKQASLHRASPKTNQSKLKTNPGLRAKTPGHHRLTGHWQTLLLFAILLLQTTYVALIALGQPLIFWDSWVNWSIKARAFFMNQTISPALFSDASRAVTHLDYPLLLPLAQASLYQLVGAPDDRFVGWIALGFFLALVSLVYVSARAFGATRTRALLAAAVVGALPTLALLAAENYADIPLAVYGIVTATYLLRWIERAERGALAVALVGAACLAWTKREGLVLALAISFSAFVLYPRVRRARVGSIACVLASSVVAVSWTLWLTVQGTTNPDHLPLTGDLVLQNLARIPTIASYFAGSIVSMQWGFVWLCAALIVLLRLARRAGATHDLYLVSASLYVLTMSLSYIFSDYAPYTAHLASSGYRLVAHVTPFIIIWLALQRAPQPNITDPTTSDQTSHIAQGFQQPLEKRFSFLLRPDGKI